MFDDCLCFLFFFFFKQKTAYDISVRDWSSDVCSSDLRPSLPSRSVARRRESARSWRRTRASRSEERRVGKECERLCRSRRSPYPEKNKNNHNNHHHHPPHHTQHTHTNHPT